MTDKLAVIIATKPSPHPEHVQAQGERWLLEEYNCTLMNNGIHKEVESDNPNAKFIIPIFGYKESWSEAFETYQQYDFSHGNVYYYNCGGTIDGESWNGLDEPGTRGNFAEAASRYEQARAELRCVKAFLPGLKRVVAHPWPVIHKGEELFYEEDWLMNMDVAAWRLSLMEQHMAEYAERVAQVPELWAYLINTDFHEAEASSAVKMEGWALSIGPRVRDVGATTLLINDVSLLPYLFNAETRRPTDVGLALLQGCKEA